MGIMERRASGRACFIASFMPALKELERCLAAKEEDSLLVHDLIRDGHDIVSSLLDEVHVDGPITPIDPWFVCTWETQALALCADGRRLSPRWFAEWTGPSSKGPLVDDWLIMPPLQCATCLRPLTWGTPPETTLCANGHKWMWLPGRFAIECIEPMDDSHLEDVDTSHDVDHLSMPPAIPIRPATEATALATQTIEEAWSAAADLLVSYLRELAETLVAWSQSPWLNGDVHARLTAADRLGHDVPRDRHRPEVQSYRGTA